MIKKFLIPAVFCVFTVSLFSLDLSLASEDIVIKQSLEGGYYLHIRKKPDIDSVIITESTEDPEHRAATYSWRNPVFHPENGNEKRMLDGEFLPADRQIYSLIDSTPEKSPYFDEAFKIFIPYVVIYGYSWSRNGEILVVDGTYFSIRTFAKPYGNYEAGYQDNPFILRVTQKSEPEEKEALGNYMDDTVRDFSEIALEGRGDTKFSKGEADVLDKIAEIIEKAPGKTLDLVLALDTTQSMENDIPYLQRELLPLLRERTGRFERFRFGMVMYRDYLEEYLTRVIGFQNSLDSVQSMLDGLTVFGGRDIPEAVYEALYTGIIRFPWQSDSRLIILIGDAPPHPRPRGSITKEMVYSEALKQNVTINTIILPQ
ncbi:MAG: hypothetical protein ACLFST_02840 [Spirochaetia bacterium]